MSHYHITYNDQGEIKSTIITADTEQEAGKLFSKLHSQVSHDQILSVKSAAMLASDQRRRIIYGTLFASLGLVIVIFTQNHQPIDDLASAANALVQGREWGLKRNYYYLFLGLGVASLAAAGIQMLKYFKESSSVTRT